MVFILWHNWLTYQPITLCYQEYQTSLTTMQGQRDLREAAAHEMGYERNNGWRFCAGPHWWGDRLREAIVTDLWPLSTSNDVSSAVCKAINVDVFAFLPIRPDDDRSIQSKRRQSHQRTLFPETTEKHPLWAEHTHVDVHVLLCPHLAEYLSVLVYTYVTSSTACDRQSKQWCPTPRQMCS